jgi:chromosome segregation ATPase
MRTILANIFTRQTPSPGSSEGLPYWIFWLLLCVILLLLVFIFLRDKDLRRRINLFLFGAKKKLIKIRLGARLKRECRKKDDVIRNLGKKSWEAKLNIPNGEKTVEELEMLEKNKQDLEREFNDAHEKISGLEADQEKFIQKHKESVTQQESVKKSYQEKSVEIKDEERVLEVKVTEKQKELEGLMRGINSAGNRIDEKFEDLNKKREKMDTAIKKLVEKRLNLEKERKDHQKKIEDFDKKLKMIEEGGKKRIREFHKEIKEWKRNKEKLHEKIEIIEKKKEPFFVRLGKQADETRETQEELSVFYSQIDRSNERIGDLEQQIKNL